MPDGGTVQFKASGNNIGAPVPIDGNGVATYSTSALDAGIHNITAEYSGTTNYETSTSNTVVQVVNKKGTISYLMSSKNPSTLFEEVTFKDSVAGSVPDGGSVQFKDGETNLGTPVPIDANGVATYSTSLLSVGMHSISAVYTGSSNFDTSTSNIVLQEVQQRSTVSILTSSHNPSIYFEEVTFKDSVTGSVPDGGTVQFKDNGNNLGSPVPIDGNGVAIYSTSTLTGGTHNITAEYSGTSNYQGSTSNTLVQIVQQKATTSFLSSSSNPSIYFEEVTFKDSVTGSIPDGGTVQFKNGGTNLDSPVPINGDGVATLTISALSAGTHNITAEYSGTNNYQGSISNTVEQVVGKKATTSVLTSSLNPSTFGQSVTFKDSVYGSVPDGGTVQFKNGGSNLGSPVPINENGVATLTTSVLSAGTHNITAEYSGTSNFEGSISNTVVQVVDRKGTVSFLTSSKNPSIYFEEVTFRDSITGSVPDGGTVQFKNNGNNLGSPVPINENGVAIYTTSTLTAGNHNITAEYSGTSNYEPSVASLIN